MTGSEEGGGVDPLDAADDALVAAVETGRYEVYTWRPLACRTMGPPVRIGGVDLPPCPHCFAAAPPAEVERCRATPDPEGKEDALLDDRERRLHARGETIVAFALHGSFTRPRVFRVNGPT